MELEVKAFMERNSRMKILIASMLEEDTYQWQILGQIQMGANFS